MEPSTPPPAPHPAARSSPQSPRNSDTQSTRTTASAPPSSQHSDSAETSKTPKSPRSLKYTPSSNSESPPPAQSIFSPGQRRSWQPRSVITQSRDSRSYSKDTSTPPAPSHNNSADKTAPSR